MLTFVLKITPDVVQLYSGRPLLWSAFLFLYHCQKRLAVSKTQNRPDTQVTCHPRLGGRPQRGQGVTVVSGRFCFKYTLERRLELLEEAKVVLEVVSEVTNLPLEHRNTLYTHTECESAVLLAVNA